MRKANGFFLIETSVALLFIFGVMLASIQSYNFCLRKLVRENALTQALELCESTLMGGEELPLQAGLRVQRLDRAYGDFKIVEVQVIKNEEIIFNLVQFQ